MSTRTPAANPRPWGASLTLSAMLVVAYLAATLYQSL
jgi:hypothetical protein